MERAPLPTGELRKIAAPDGDELFAVVGLGAVEQLWTRHRDGVWDEVALPEGTRPEGRGALDLAVADDGGLWVAVNGEGKHGVYRLEQGPTRS